MLEISLCTEAARIAPMAKRCGRPPSAALYLYRATDRDEELAACLFEVESERVTALLYEALPAQENDTFLFDAVLRAGLNYASGQGLETGCIPESLRARHSAFFAQLNYPAQPVFDITNFFNKYKNCRPAGG